MKRVLGLRWMRGQNLAGKRCHPPGSAPPAPKKRHMSFHAALTTS
ncbi:hypothetical protein Mspyr1_54450 (plasmid) [Mycolicibacterium gilvum Spyr1]|uniref:Uncharacterized protein n=1 Tax=Mycolicibacterium gilvum (strain DSM 45189 / LMG 24558 / Spyr1) TaxID=278137 RepID=E6TQ35_MYCSR|nr:hypothetical protein Mspyr1_54450 [Mycolicibacterium gilvum Spyr1]